MKKALVACEFSGRVREALRRRGIDAWSCDYDESEASSPAQEYHIIGDVREVLNENWDLLIGHPPCTYLTNAGVRHLHSIPSCNGVVTAVHGDERWNLMEEACKFFNLLKNSSIPHIAIENPIPHVYAKNRIGAYTQIIQPYEFGHPETKATCLWLKGLPKLRPTKYVPVLEARVHNEPPGPDRAKNRSRTFLGIAEAMAEQWGPLI